MALAQNGAFNSLGGLSVAGSSVGPLTHAVGGTSLTGTALMMVVFSLASATSATQTVSTVTDSNGNTWNRLYSVSSGSGWNTPDMLSGGQKGLTLECWYTKNATIGTSINISATFSGSVNACAVTASAKFTGYDSTQPFDQHASLPAVQLRTTSGSRVTPSLSTTNTHILPFAIWASIGTNFGSSNDSFNGVAKNDSAIQQENGTVEFTKCDIQCGVATTGPYSSITYTGSSAYDNGWFVGFALTSDPTIVGPSGTWASTEATDVAHFTGYVGAFGQIGFLQSTEATDIFAAIGNVAAVGGWASTEGVDIFSAFGGQPLRGVWASTEAKDIFAATGTGRGENGIWVSTEAPDIFSAVGRPALNGVFITTENADRFSAFGVGVSQVRRRRRLIIT